VKDRVGADAINDRLFYFPAIKNVEDRVDFLFLEFLEGDGLPGGCGGVE
jgi:hypothetical protein